jgi:chemotaxis protein CheZ
MAEPKPKKPYSAELRQRPSVAAAVPETGASDEAARLRHQEILAAIQSLREHFRLPTAPAGAPAPRAADGPLLSVELENLRSAIAETKREIAALRHPGSTSPDPLVSATGELDAVVKATESATHTILATAEGLEEIVQRLSKSELDGFVSAGMDEMKEMIIKIYEACNFQDITGQRINKVVKTMMYVEERVNAMIAIWGTDSFLGIDVPAGEAADADKALLDGPQLPENAVSQDEIDKLFT